VLVGSAAECGVRVLDASVAGVHCALLQTPGGVWVVDLLAPGGVLVNGSPTRFALVEAGDEVRVGRSSIRLRRKSSARPAEGLEQPARAPADAGGKEAMADHAALIEQALTPIAERLARTQQQAIDELRQAGAEVIRSYAAQHQEQLALVQRELDQFRQVTRELDALRADLSPRAAAGYEEPPPQAPVRLGIARAASEPEPKRKRRRP
jgi:hypothetical protein